MKTNARFIALAVSAILLAGVLAGCTQTGMPAASEEGAIIDIEFDMVPLAAGAPTAVLRLPTAPGTQVAKNAKAEIDHSNTRDGYVMIRFLQSTSKSLAVQVIGPSSVTYTYTLRADGRHEVFPLSDGNGRYTIRVLEQVEGSRFSLAISTEINVTLADEFAPFLRPNQYVNFNRDSRVVAKASELATGVDGMPARVSAIYNFVIQNISYDRELARTVQSGYIPNVDAVLERGKGICFDYAALMTAMLRSLGIPTRLVIGYAGDVYHAWIDVHSEETGWINSVIFFDGSNWHLMDPTFASTANQSAEVMRFIGDGKNYSARYLY